MSNKGFVKLSRDISNKPWYNNGNTLRVYIELLISAAWKDFEYNGATIKSGQFITSVGKLAERCQLSVQQTRTALSRLKSTNDITISTTSKFSIITVHSNNSDNEINKPVDNFADDQADISVNNRNRKEKEEDKKEIKEIESEEAAALPSPSPVNSSKSFNSPVTRADLADEYGEENVSLYESKYDSWAAKKGISDFSNMYRVIAKWLDEDKDSLAPRTSSFAMDDVMRKIIGRYKSD